MAMTEYTVRDGMPYVTINGTEYPLYNDPIKKTPALTTYDPLTGSEGDTRVAGQASPTQGYVVTGPDTGYFVNAIPQGTSNQYPFDLMRNGGVQYLPSISGYMEAARQAAANDPNDVIGPAIIAALTMGGVGIANAVPALGAGTGTAATATSAAMTGALGAETLPYFDAAAGWINPATGSIMTEAEALAALTPAAQAGNTAALGSLTNYANTMGSTAGMVGSALPAASALNPGMLSSAAQAAGSTAPAAGTAANAGMLGSAATALNSALGTNMTAQELGSMLGLGTNLLGSYMNTQTAQNAAKDNANAQIEAAKIAAEAAKFKPIGVTTNFGQSQFGYDANGNLTSAGYTLTPQMKAQQDALMGMSGNMLSQYQNAVGQTAPMGDAAQRAMTLGSGYLAADPAAQSKMFYDQQQALLAGSREQQLAELQNKLLAQGRLGLATGGTSTGMLPTNPEMAAYYNALQQQDLQLAANATQGGMDYAKFGAGMVGTGGNLLNSMYGTQVAAYDPYKTALGGAQTIEGLGQNALELGMNLGNTVTAANAKSGSLLGTGMMNAANTQFNTSMQTGDPWANLLQGAGSYLTNNYGANPATQQYKYDPFTGRPISFGS